MGSKPGLTFGTPTPPPPPNPNDAATAKAMEDAAALERKIKGRASTILNTPSSLTSSPAATAKRTLSA